MSTAADRERSRFQALIAGGPPDKTVRALAAALALAADARFTELRALYGAARDLGVATPILAEGALSAHLFAGFPRAIEAFAAFESVFGPSPCPSDDRPRDGIVAAGAALFARIYGPLADPVRGQLRAFGPDFDRAVIEDAYGRVLSRPQIPASTRELMAIAALASLGLDRQLFSHLRGAIACGASRADAAAMIELAAELAPERAAIARATLARALPEDTPDAPHRGA